MSWKSRSWNYCCSMRVSLKAISWKSRSWNSIAWESRGKFRESHYYGSRMRVPWESHFSDGSPHGESHDSVPRNSGSMEVSWKCRETLFPSDLCGTFYLWDFHKDRLSKKPPAELYCHESQGGTMGVPLGFNRITQEILGTLLSPPWDLHETHTRPYYRDSHDTSMRLSCQPRPWNFYNNCIMKLISMMFPYDVHNGIFTGIPLTLV